jgi:ATP-binding cassette, subfamily C, bacterial
MLTWQGIFDEIRSHRKTLLQANIVALLAVMAAVPVPLLLPLMVDEVLLNHPGPFVAAIGAWFPQGWHGPLLFIGAALLITVCLRLTAILLNVWQGRAFSLMAKQVVYRIRSRMLDRLSKIALSEFETVGAGRVTSHFRHRRQCDRYIPWRVDFRFPGIDTDPGRHRRRAVLDALAVGAVHFSAESVGDPVLLPPG